MDVLDLISLVSRWLHIIPATILVGGTIYMRFVLVRPVREQGASDNLQDEMRSRWARLVMISIGLLLVSGLYNSAIKSINYDLDMVYNGLLGIKILLGLVIFYLASLLAGRSDRAKRFRERQEYWLTIQCVLMIAVIMVAGYMKMMNPPLKSGEDEVTVVRPLSQM